MSTSVNQTRSQNNNICPSPERGNYVIFFEAFYMSSMKMSISARPFPHPHYVPSNNHPNSN